MNADETPTTRLVTAVTGGASGIGLEFVRTWVSSGGRAVILDRNPEDAQRVVAELGEENVRAIT
ncbi:SDR family oxidoreductase, partial [Arthrobacter bambusae]|uniref:SDR family NAD(P)-dependent oxidoreductase n=1 Tax=Arthrobacter bambusae TaxID=1338426 RepID=UPI001F50D789